MLRKISSTDFTHTFRQIWDSEDRRFCFVLGAGASKSSGIRTGAELAKVWLDEIKDQKRGAEPEFDKFISENKIDVSNPGISYPQIYRERFCLDAESGFENINKELKNAHPGYGYSVLAQILAEKQHNIVITTNFDNLTEEALYTYTSTRPLVCGHESLAMFAKPSPKRPLIIKIHRDRFFGPQSLPEETGTINKAWVEVLNHIFRSCTPVFIGYGGNDGSMMGYLEEIGQFDNIFWCERKGVAPSDRVLKFLNKHRGKLVEINGFDELMFLLQANLPLPLLDKYLTAIAEDRANNYREAVAKIQKTQSASPDKDVQAAAEKIVNDALADWWGWELKARATSDPDEKEKIYKQAIEKFPDSPGLLGNYANFLNNSRNHYNEAEKLYTKALKLDPNNPANNGNYANFLKGVRRQYEDAGKLFKKALELDPQSANKHGNYAGFLFMTGQGEAATPYLNYAIQHCDRKPLMAELLFYQYAHIPSKSDEALAKLKELLRDGTRSIGFGLQDNIDKAIQQNHPNPKMLQHLADVLTKDAPLDDIGENK